MKVCSVCRRCYEDSALSCSAANHPALIEARAGNCEMIANYRLDTLHESAPSGETYRAVNQILKKPYLVSIVAPASFGGGQALRDAFLRETRALAAIVHPYLGRVFESGVLADGALYVVTEFLPAQTLRDLFRQTGVPSEITALTIARQTAEALEAMHAAGALHRGVRPENIVLTTDADNRLLVKLQNIDFGGLRQKQVVENAGLYLNDLRYFSPEQCVASAETDAQTDVYALGVVLYEMLAGRPPFDAPDAGVLINRQLNEPPPPVKVNNFDIRMLLTHTLSDALQKTARLRLKSANALARRLRHIEQLATHSPTPPPAIAYPASMEKTPAVFTPPVKMESRVAFEDKAFAANAVSAEKPLVEAIEAAPKPFIDLTTNKLPPLESIVENHHFSAPVFNEPTETIGADREPARVEWQQPDDIPELPKATAPKRESIIEEPVLTADEEFDDDERVEILAPFLASLRSYVSSRPAFFDAESRAAWNLPDKRKLLAGAGVVALIVLAIGGTILNRRLQTSRLPDRTSAQTAPVVKTAPKTVEPEKIIDNERPATVSPETIAVNDSTTDVPALSELRDVNEPPIASVSPNRSRKRAPREVSESVKNVVNETLADKKTEATKSADQKNQASTVNKPEIFTRPRIVKDPKF